MDAARRRRDPLVAGRGDIDHDGALEVAATDLEGKVYVWDASGHLVWKREANPAYGGKPLEPFHNVRCGTRCRTHHGFIASPCW